MGSPNRLARSPDEDNFFKKQNDKILIMTDIDFEKFEQLSEEERKAITSKWTDEDWGEYYMNGGAVSIDDFFQELEDETIEMAQEKYNYKTKGNNIE